MATWRKALVLGLAVVVGAVPVLAQVDLELQAAVPEVQQSSYGELWRVRLEASGPVLYPNDKAGGE